MSGIGLNAGSQGRRGHPYGPGPTPPPVIPNEVLEAWVHRYEVYISGGSLMPYKKVSREITTLMRENMEVGAYTFAMISQKRLEIYWMIFQGECKWDPAITDQVYQMWYWRSSVLYDNMISNWKKKWEEEETTQCYNSVVWQGLLDYWNTQDRDVQLSAKHLSQAVEGSSYSSPTWDMSHCGRLTKMRRISELVSTASSSSLYSQEEVDYLLALEREKLPEMMEARFIPMRKEIGLARAECARRCGEKCETQYAYMQAQRIEQRKMWEQRMEARLIEQRKVWEQRMEARLIEQRKKWQQSMQGPDPNVGGDCSGSKGRGSS